MTSESHSRFVIDLHAAACERLAQVDCISLITGGSEAPCQVAVGLPISYARQRRRRYPLVIVFDAAAITGSVIEISRLMTETKEIRESIVVAVRTPTSALLALPGMSALLTEPLLAALGKKYRVDAGAVIAFAGGDGAAVPALKAAADARLRVFGQHDHGVPAFVDALRSTLSTGIEYGRGMPALRRRAWTPLMRMISPLARRLMQPSAARPARESLHRLHSKELDRDFEIFVSLPDTAGPAQRVPALFVLDATIEFSIVAESAQRLAAAGLIEPIAVVGVGVPRAEGHYSFAFRRFEEFSPPLDGYACDDDLGHIFRALFALRGADARRQLGRAPDLLRFLSDELMPALGELPIDDDALGLLGHSAGGTFVGYALHQAHSPFRHYIGISPGVAISGDWLMRDRPDPAPEAASRSALFVIGSEEKSNAFNIIAGIPRTHAYVERLRSCGVEARYTCYDGETHSTIYPRAVDDALTATYPRAAAAQQRRTA
jgi:predicted alpha/beta superfamily hydrolase